MPLSTLRSFNFRQKKTLAIVSFSLFVDMTIYYVMVPILPKLLSYSHIESNRIGALFSSYSAGYLLSSPVVGYLSDLYGSRRYPLLLGHFSLLIAALIFSMVRSLWCLLLARFLQGNTYHLSFSGTGFIGIAAACTWTIGMALLSDVYSADYLGTVMGIANGCNTLGYIVGPLLGTIMAESFRAASPFYICLLLVLIDFIARASVSDASDTSDIPKRSPLLTNPGHSISQVFFLPAFWANGTALLLVASSFSSFESLVSVHLQDAFGYAPRQILIIFLCMIVSSIVFSFIWGFLSAKFHRFRLILIGTLLFISSHVCLAFSEQPVVFGLSSIFFGASSSIVMAPTMPGIAELYSGDKMPYAQLYSIVNVFYALGMLFGPLASSYFYEKSGFQISMLVLSVGLALFLPLCSWLSIGKVK